MRYLSTSFAIVSSARVISGFGQAGPSSRRITPTLSVSPPRRNNRYSQHRSQIDDGMFDNLEKQVKASAQSSRDFQKVIQSLDEPDAAVRNDLTYDTEDLSKPPPSQLQVAAAAAIITSALAFMAVHSIVITLSLACFVFIAATLDDNTLSGAIARILGRTTIRSVEVTQPKIKAVARAVVTGEQEVATLKERIASLETEVKELRQWKAQRIKFERGMATFSLNDLRYMAKQKGLPDYGTKADLLVRLVKANIIRFDEL